MSISEDQVKALGKELGDQILEDSKEFLKTVTDEDKDFFQDIGKRYARNYLELKFGDEEDKSQANRAIEALGRASKSKVAERGMDLVEHGADQIASIIKTVGGTILKLAMFAI